MHTPVGALSAVTAVSSFETVLADESGSVEDSLHILDN